MSKFCSNCGSKLEEGQDLCLGCGAIINKKINKEAKSFNVLAVVGFVISIIIFIIWFIPGMFVIGIISLVLSIIGLMKSKKVNNGKGLSIAGIVLSSIAICFSLVFSFLFLIGVLVLAEEADVTDDCVREYGKGYEAVEGYELYDFDDDGWYCCYKGHHDECIEIDR